MNEERRIRGRGRRERDTLIDRGKEKEIGKTLIESDGDSGRTREFEKDRDNTGQKRTNRQKERRKVRESDKDIEILR